ncbi:putative extracellular serine carboxypeptidase [Paramyrothecium foliicola]|nr:putative extracellular serine carboxypeptidase [Paramyrothecium foliicola]
MKSSLLLKLAPCAALLQGALGMFPKISAVEPLELDDEEVFQIASADFPLTGNGTFETFIDHNNPKLGKFPLRYWYNATTFKGPGSPIILMTPGEIAADNYGGYLTDRSMTGVYAKNLGGAVVMVEHRYYGDSTPYESLSTKALQYHTLDQAVADFVLLARKINLPFDKSGKTNAPKAPWVWVGGSYSGALAAWIEKLSPGTFWAYHGSSGPLEAIYDYWQYFQPIQEGMPKNCSRDFEAIIDHVDKVLLRGSKKERKALKEQFGVAALEYDDDAAQSISSPIWAWQSIQFNSGYSQFYQMCDAIQGFTANTTNNPTSSSPRGVGLKKALPNYAEWFRSSYLPGYCENNYEYSDWKGTDNVQCWNTHNKTMEVWRDWSTRSSFYRSWVWQTCNDPFFYYQTGAPKGTPTVFSRLVGPEYYQRQCDLLFPREGPFTFASNRGKTAQDLNRHTGGWFNTKTTRLITTNGEFDPWRSASIASVFRPGGPFKGTKDAPSLVIEGARHCNDLTLRNAVHAPVAAAQEVLLKQITKWVGDFYNKKIQRSARNIMEKDIM